MLSVVLLIISFVQFLLKSLKLSLKLSNDNLVLLPLCDQRLDPLLLTPLLTSTT